MGQQTPDLTPVPAGGASIGEILSMPKNCVYYSTFRKEAQPRFPDIFLPQPLRQPGAVHAIRLLLGLSVHAGVKFFQEGMIIPVCFVAWHRVDIDVMDAVENAFFDIRIIPF